MALISPVSLYLKSMIVHSALLMHPCPEQYAFQHLSHPSTSGRGNIFCLIISFLLIPAHALEEHMFFSSVLPGDTTIMAVLADKAGYSLLSLFRCQQIAKCCSFVFKSGGNLGGHAANHHGFYCADRVIGLF